MMRYTVERAYSIDVLTGRERPDGWDLLDNGTWRQRFAKQGDALDARRALASAYVQSLPMCRCLTCRASYRQPFINYIHLDCPKCMASKDLQVSDEIPRPRLNDAQGTAYCGASTTTTRAPQGTHNTGARQMTKKTTTKTTSPTTDRSAEIKALLAKLEKTSDPDEKKAIRRALRTRGHRGGLGLRGSTKSTKKAVAKKTSSKKVARKGSTKRESLGQRDASERPARSTPPNTASAV